MRHALMVVLVVTPLPALACSVTKRPPLSPAIVERMARDVHRGAADLVEMRTTGKITAERDGRAIVLRSVKGRFAPGQEVVIATDICFVDRQVPAGTVFRTYLESSRTLYSPLDRGRQRLLIRLGLMPAAWGVAGR